MTTYSVLNDPRLWIFAILIFAIVIVQAVIFSRISRAATAEAGMERKDVTRAMRAGAVSAIGPSLAIAFVAIGMIGIFGTPATLMRFGLVGSVTYELMAANIASESFGVTLGGDGFDDTAWATTFLMMAIGAGVWMLGVLLFAKSMGKLSERAHRWNPVMMSVVPAAAMLAAFFYFGFGQVTSAGIPLVVLLTSGAVMGSLLLVSRIFNIGWLKEWGLGIAMFAGVGAAAVLV